MSATLLVIDLQNDYFDNGSFPLHDAQGTCDRIVSTIHAARAAGIPVVHIQHIVQPAPGPFFNPDTVGAALHPAIAAAAPHAPVVVKHYADAFEQTRLEAVLTELGTTRLLVCGMMTQNCVTHTAISKAAERFASVTVLPDCCTTVTEMLHLIALHALSTRVDLVPSGEALRV